MLKTSWAFLLALLLGACGGGGGASGGSASSNSSSASSSASSKSSSSSASSVASSASSSSSNSSSSSSSSSSASSSSSSSASSASSGLYLSEPNVSACVAGQLNAAERTAVLNRINAVRARHGLLAVSYDSSDDAAAAEAALYMVANNTLTHSPSSSGTCYSSEAARLAGKSNLYMMSSSNTRSSASADAIPVYLKDTGVGSLGHRRWVLSPFLGKISFGRVDGNGSMASVLRVMGGELSDIGAMSNDFVAYPYGSYPASDFSTSDFLSFSAIASKTSAWGSGSTQVSYAAATVSVVSAGGASLTISELSSNYEGYGLPNLLKWKAAGLSANVDYTVTIGNVTVNGATRQFQYTFRLQ